MSVDLSPRANVEETWQLSDGTITRDFSEWHIDNAKQFSLRKREKAVPLFSKLLEGIGIPNKPMWEYKPEWERKRDHKFKYIPPANSIHYNSWSIERSVSKAGRLFKLNLSLKTESSYSGQYDGYGVYEVSGEEEIKKSRSYAFIVHKPEENQQIWQEDLVASLKKEMPKIKLLNIEEDKECLLLEVGGVGLEEIGNFFVKKEDIPQKNMLDYLEWQKIEEKCLI